MARNAPGSAEICLFTFHWPPFHTIPSRRIVAPERRRPLPSPPPRSRPIPAHQVGIWHGPWPVGWTLGRQPIVATLGTMECRAVVQCRCRPTDGCRCSSSRTPDARFTRPGARVLGPLDGAHETAFPSRPCTADRHNHRSLHEATGTARRPATAIPSCSRRMMQRGMQKPISSDRRSKQRAPHLPACLDRRLGPLALLPLQAWLSAERRQRQGRSVSCVDRYTTPVCPSMRPRMTDDC